MRRLWVLAIGVALVGTVMLRGAPDEQSGRYTTWSAFGGSLDSMQ